MKKDNNPKPDYDLRPEYDFSKLSDGVRGKYAESYRAGTNLVHLDPDVAAVFKTEDAVNKALRSLIDIARVQVPSSE